MIRKSRFLNHTTVCKEKCHGGVIYLSISSVEVDACIFSNNTLEQGKPLVITYGGVLGSYKGNFTIKWSTFTYNKAVFGGVLHCTYCCLLYTSPSPRDATLSRMPSSA